MTGKRTVAVGLLVIPIALTLGALRLTSGASSPSVVAGSGLAATYAGYPSLRSLVAGSTIVVRGHVAGVIRRYDDVIATDGGGGQYTGPMPTLNAIGRAKATAREAGGGCAGGRSALQPVSHRAATERSKCSGADVPGCSRPSGQLSAA